MSKAASRDLLQALMHRSGCAGRAGHAPQCWGAGCPQTACKALSLHRLPWHSSAAAPATAAGLPPRPGSSQPAEVSTADKLIMNASEHDTVLGGSGSQPIKVMSSTAVMRGKGSTSQGNSQALCMVEQGGRVTSELLTMTAWPSSSWPVSPKALKMSSCTGTAAELRHHEQLSRDCQMCEVRVHTR